MGKMQLALREMRLSFTQTKTMIVLAVVSLVCAASGPFGTQDTLTVLARIAYWGVVVVSTYGFGVFLHFVLAPEDHRTTLAKRVIACGVAAAIAVYISVLNIAVIPGYPVIWGDRIQQGVIIFSVSLFISLAFDVLSRVTEPDESAVGTCVLLDRIPYEKRGPLVSLHAEDHYVRVETTKGSELILMRLADAIELAAPVVGLRVHRSHWVAVDQVRDYKKTNDVWSVVVSTGQSIPISRGFRGDAVADGIVSARG